MLGYETDVVNGVMVNVAPKAAFNPLLYGPAYVGAAWPRQGVYQVPPIVPSSASTVNFGSNVPASGAVPVNPYHPTKSPVIWVIVFLGLSLLLLYKVHYS